MSGNPQNTGFCNIYPTAARGLVGPQTPGLNFSASLAHLLFQNSLLLLKVENPGSIYFRLYESGLFIIMKKVIITLVWITIWLGPLVRRVFFPSF